MSQVCAALLLEAMLGPFCRNWGFPSTITASHWQLWGTESCCSGDWCSRAASEDARTSHWVSLVPGRVCTRRVWQPRDSLQLPQPTCRALIPLPASCLGSFPGIFHRLGYIWDQQPITPFLTDSLAGAWLQQEALREGGQHPKTVLPSIFLLQLPLP